MRGVYIYTYYYIIKYSDEKTKKQTKKNVAHIFKEEK